jgi:hypothetical protein
MKRALLLSFVLVHAVFITTAQQKKDSLATILTDTIPYATLYVYRQPHRGGAHLSYDLYMVDSVICRVRNDSKYIIRLYKEGKTIFWAKTERKATKEIDVQYGKAYYLKCDVTQFGVFVMSPSLQLMYEEYGKFDFKGVEGKNNKPGN